MLAVKTEERPRYMSPKMKITEFAGKDVIATSGEEEEELPTTNPKWKDMFHQNMVGQGKYCAPTP